MIQLKFESAVFFVEDIEKAKNFYGDILGQKITMDFGRNVAFEGGFAIWEKDYAIKTIFSEKAKSISVGGNNSEIYFETVNLEELYTKLEGIEDLIEIIHPIHEHPWGQRAFRIYDPDKHIVEVGEPMFAVVIRYYEEGMDVNEISKKTLMPINIIEQILENIKK